MNNKVVIFIIVAISLTGCGKAQYHDSELQPYAEEFEQLYNVSTSGIKIEFGTSFDKSDTNGSCENSAFSHTILIKRENWDTYDDRTKKTLLFHELGHCVFNRTHTSTQFTDGCPTSMMAPDTLIEGCQEVHWDAYVAELPHS